MKDREIRNRALASALFGILGIVLVTRYADHFTEFRVRWLALLGVVTVSVGIPYAIGLLVAPSPHALKIRHMAAGAAAAWLAYELSGGARRMGIEATSDAFRVLWAPLSEEACKTLLLAAIWARSDDRSSRRDIVTVALGVGIGFAIRENFVYFNAALGTSTIYLEWVILRAIPPVLAHAAFAMILGGTVAQGALHSRVVGEATPRVSVLGGSVAAIVHIAYNGIALVLTRWGGSYAIELTMLWSLCAAVVAFALRARVIRVASADEPIVTTVEPMQDRSGVLVLSILGVVAASWMIPAVLPRYLAVVFTPIAIGLAAAAAVARAVRMPRVLTPLLLGIAMRPLVRAPELVLASIAQRLHSRTFRVPLEFADNMLWLGAICLATYFIARRRDRLAAVGLAAGLSAGLIGSSIGGMLANSNSASMMREMLAATLGTLPRTFALAVLAGRFAYRSPSHVLGATVSVAAIATCLGVVLRWVHPGWVTMVIVLASSIALSAAVVMLALRRSRMEREAGSDRAL